jgi:hypothetical protein
MNRMLRLVGLCAALVSCSSTVLALSAEDLARAEKILTVIAKLNAKYPNASGLVKAPPALTDKSGKFHLPLKADGTTTEWAQKILSAQVGAALGEKAAEKASGAALSHVPMGGLLSGVAKKKGKELGAVAAVGGPEFIKQTSDLSFDTLADYAVYLHVKFAGQPNFSQALATAMAIYPSLEKDYDRAVKAAYEQAEAQAKADAKAAKK